MKTKILVLSGVLVLLGGVVSASYWGLQSVRYGAFRASERIRSGDEVAFRERLPRGTYLVSLYGTRGEQWRARDDRDYWGLFGRGASLSRDVRGLESRSVEVEPRGQLGDERLRAEPLELQVERRYANDGKLDAVRPRERDLRTLRGEPTAPGAKAAPRGPAFELDYRGIPDLGWHRDLPARHKGGPDVDIYIFNRYGRLIARADSYESSESLLLDIDQWSGQTVEIVVHSARGSGSFHLTLVRF